MRNLSKDSARLRLADDCQGSASAGRAGWIGYEKLTLLDHHSKQIGEVEIKMVHADVRVNTCKLAVVI